MNSDQRATKGLPCNRLPNPIFLCSPANEILRHKFIEKYVMFKWDQWKNNPRANFLLFRAILSIISVSFLLGVVGSLLILIVNGQNELRNLFSAGNIARGVLGLGGAASVAFWKMSDLYRQQWHYCCDIYIKSLALKPGHEQNLLMSALAIDLVVVDLWAHRSFRDFFREELWEALCWYYKDEPTRFEDDIKAICEKKYEEDRAHEILERYHTHLLNLPPINTSPVPGSAA